MDADDVRPEGTAAGAAAPGSRTGEGMAGAGLPGDDPAGYGPAGEGPSGEDLAGGDPAAHGPAGARPPVSHLVVGAVTLTGERLHIIGERQLPAIALAVGVVAESRQALGRAVESARQAVPREQMRDMLDTASSHGRQAVDASQSETSHWLRSVVGTAVGAPVKWVENKVIPKIIEDMMPYVVNNLMPKMIDEVLPQIRTVVVPVIIDDLTTDPKVRTMITEQSTGVVTAATDELRDATAEADDHVEAAFRNVFRRHSNA